MPLSVLTGAAPKPKPAPSPPRPTAQQLARQALGLVSSSVTGAFGASPRTGSFGAGIGTAGPAVSMADYPRTPDRVRMSDLVGARPMGERATAGAGDDLGTAWALANTLAGPSLLGLQQDTAFLRNQLARLPEMYGLRREQARTETGFGLEGIKLSRRELRNAQNLHNELYRLAKLGFNLTAQQARRLADEAMIDFVGGTAARGAVSAPGHGRGVRSIEQGLGEQLSGLHLQRKESWQRWRAGRKQFRIDAKRLNLSERELRTRLDQALRTLGLQEYFDTQQLYRAIGSNNTQLANAALGVYDQAMQLAPYMPGGKQGAIKLPTSPSGGPPGLSPLPKGYRPRDGDLAAGGARSGHSRRRGSLAWDFPTPAGTQAAATMPGVVIYSNQIKGSYGNHVIVLGDNGRHYLYGHLSARTVAKGQRVNAGQVVGLTGSSGNSTGNHLHYEIW